MGDRIGNRGAVVLPFCQLRNPQTANHTGQKLSPCRIPSIHLSSCLQSIFCRLGGIAHFNTMVMACRHKAVHRLKHFAGHQSQDAFRQNGQEARKHCVLRTLRMPLRVLQRQILRLNGQVTVRFGDYIYKWLTSFTREWRVAFFM